MTTFNRRTIPRPPSSGMPPLSHGELHLWLADRDAWTGCDWDSVLSAEELARASRCRHATDRDRARASRGLLRRLLGGYLGTAPASVRLGAEACGKPRLQQDADHATLAFNASGSAHLALFAFARGCPVGVDVEAFATASGGRGKRLPAPRDVRSIAARFAAEETALIHGLSAADAATAFLRLWTCKEACLKCHGTGLRTPLDAIRIELLDDTRATGRLGHERFVIRTLVPGDGSIAAVAMAGDGMPEPTCWTLTP